MISIIIGSHGDFASALLKSAEIIYGRHKNVAAIAFNLGESTELLLSKYEKALEELDTEEGVLFLVDILGGSPYNVAAILAAQNKNTDILAGINLPLLIEIFSNREGKTVHELVQHSLSIAQSTVVSFSEVIKTYNKEEL